jgi:hypothetical protein
MAIDMKSLSLSALIGVVAVVIMSINKPQPSKGISRFFGFTNIHNAANKSYCHQDLT